MAKKPVVVGVAVLVLLGAVAAWLWHRQTAAQAAGELVLYGNVDVRQVSLAFNGSERIAELTAHEGDHVRPGQLLGRLDTRTLALRVQRARAQIDVQEQALRRLEAGSRPQEIEEARSRVRAAQVDAELATQNLDRLRATARATDGRAVAGIDLDNAQARVHSTQAQLQAQRKAADLVVAGPRQEDIAQARAQLAAARADLALMQQQLADGQLRAPVEAVVRARLLEPGDMASPQRPVYTLAITRPKWVRAWVPEPDLGRIRAGQPASVVNDSDPAHEVPGTVGYIASVAEFTPKTVQTEDLRTSLVYEVRINVDDPQDRLRLGMPVSVRMRPFVPEAR
jgi:HlyD family secretion protein